MRRPNLVPDHDLDRVADIALDVAEKIRESDPRALYDELVALAQWHPAKMAQLTMVFAAWFDPETSTGTLDSRVHAITASRMGVS